MRRNTFLSMTLVSLLLYSGTSASAQESIEAQTIDEILAVKSIDKYVNSEAGFEIDIPQGWMGWEYEEFPLAFAGPSNYTGMPEGLAQMMIVSGPKSAFKEAGLPDPEVWAEQMRELSNECTVTDGSFVNFNQIEMMRLKLECPFVLDIFGSYTHDFYLIPTETHLGIVIFLSNPYTPEARVSQFEESLNTLKVYNPVSLKETLREIYGLQVSEYEIMANGTQVEVKLESNANISNLEFHEEQKTISFKTESGANKTKSLTTLTVDKVLQEPYVVTIDDQEIADYIVVRDEIDGENIIQIAHEGGAHDIAITGTNVVPEFPISVIGATAFVIGMIS